jgi:hypothetical protein
VSRPADRRPRFEGSLGHEPPDPSPTPPDRPPTVAYLVVWYVLLGGLGLILGVVGAFHVPAGPRVAGLLLSVGVTVAVVGNVVAGLFGAAVTGSRLGAAVPLLGWILAVLPLSAQRSEGDLIIEGDAKGLAFLLLGTVSGAVPIGVAGAGPSRRLVRRGPSSHRSAGLTRSSGPSGPTGTPASPPGQSRAH